MADRVREQLLGYLLGALDDAEQEEIEKQLTEDPQLRKELALVRLQLDPLERSEFRYEPPLGLAERTCQRIFEAAPEPVGGGQLRPHESAEPVAAGFRSAEAAVVPVSSSRWTLADVAVAVGIVAAALLLVFPALVSSRFNARILDCQNRLRQLGLALSEYSADQGGYFPAVLPDGPMAFAGSYAPTLRQAGYVEDANLFFCPGAAAVRGCRTMPRLEDLQKARSAEEMRQLQSRMGGDYGYSMGYWQNGRYYATRNLGRSYFVLMADAPSGNLGELRSMNHSGLGQNVLFEDCRVIFLSVPQLAGIGDNYYLNDLGMVAAGQHRNDSVVGSSGAVPLPVPLRHAVQPVAGTAASAP